MSGIPMNPTCPRCGGKHGIEVSGDGYEWDCKACGGHLMCAIGMEGEMYPYHRKDGTCGCVGEPHTCEMDEAERAELLADARDDHGDCECTGADPLGLLADDGPCAHEYNGNRCELCDAEHPQSLREHIEANT